MPKHISVSEYIERLHTIHNHEYDYTLLPTTLSTSTRIDVVCKVHGIFTPTLNAHLCGTKCPQCNWDNKKKHTQERLIEQATLIHNGAYDYSKVVYTDRAMPVTIICKRHGEFKMRLWSHVYGPDKCPLCGSGKKRTTEDFITLAREVHGDRYDYSQSVYTKAKTKVTIICRDHGAFEQTPDSHCLTTRQGCPKCKASSGERAVYKALIDLNVHNFTCEKQFDDLVAPDTKLPLRYDFWVPSHNLLIEFDGHAHFEEVNFSGKLTKTVMEQRLMRTQYLDSIKNDYAKLHGYTLLRIHHSDLSKVHQLVRNALQSN